MFKSQVIASVSTIKVGTKFKSGKVADTDRNEKEPIALTILAGQYPQGRTILSGTVAENLGIENNKTYVFQVRETEANDYGRQFIYEAPQELKVMERIEAVAAMGNPVGISVENTPAAKENSLELEANTKFDEE